MQRFKLPVLLIIALQALNLMALLVDAGRGERNVLPGSVPVDTEPRLASVQPVPEPQRETVREKRLNSHKDIDSQPEDPEKERDSILRDLAAGKLSLVDPRVQARLQRIQEEQLKHQPP